MTGTAGMDGALQARMRGAAEGGLNLNVHCHVAVPDGVFDRRFHPKNLDSRA